MADKESLDPPVSQVEEAALRIFGSRSSRGFRRWVQYWKESRERNGQLLEDFEKVVELGISKHRVLDIGCGTGGLYPHIASRGGRYVGGDYHPHVLQLAFASAGPRLVRCSGLELPFPDAGFDLITAFDIIEHLTGGTEWQFQFLRELRRVLAPAGLLLLTTPNFWYPYDAHSDLHFPQFLPRLLRDRYIAWRNPDFIQEHKSFANIRLMRPGVLRRALRRAGLALLHDLPCSLDRQSYRALHPFLGRTLALGLGWHLHAEFWMVIGRAEERERLRSRLRQSWTYEHAQPEKGSDSGFRSGIDFRSEAGSRQLGEGWHWYQPEEGLYRWTSKRATAYLESEKQASWLRLEGYSPVPNRLIFRVNGVHVGTRELEGEQPFHVCYLLPFPDSRRRLFEVELECEKLAPNRHSSDRRPLGVQVYSLTLGA